MAAFAEDAVQKSTAGSSGLGAGVAMKPLLMAGEVKEASLEASLETRILGDLARRSEDAAAHSRHVAQLDSSSTQAKDVHISSWLRESCQDSSATGVSWWGSKKGLLPLLEILPADLLRSGSSTDSSELDGCLSGTFSGSSEYGSCSPPIIVFSNEWSSSSRSISSASSLAPSPVLESPTPGPEDADVSNVGAATAAASAAKSMESLEEVSGFLTMSSLMEALSVPWMVAVAAVRILTEGASAVVVGLNEGGDVDAWFSEKGVASPAARDRWQAPHWLDCDVPDSCTGYASYAPAKAVPRTRRCGDLGGLEAEKGNSKASKMDPTSPEAGPANPGAPPATEGEDAKSKLYTKALGNYLKRNHSQLRCNKVRAAGILGGSSVTIPARDATPAAADAPAAVPIWERRAAKKPLSLSIAPAPGMRVQGNTTTLVSNTPRTPPIWQRRTAKATLANNLISNEAPRQVGASRLSSELMKI